MQLKRNLTLHLTLAITSATVKKRRASVYFATHTNAILSNLPKLRTKQDLVSWANKLIAGKEKRLTVDEGEKKAKPMTNPSISEVQGVLDTYVQLRKAQSVKKQAFNAENKDVLNMPPEIDELIRDIYDELEFYYRKETAANKRKLTREWGVVYVSSPGEEPEENEED